MTAPITRSKKSDIWLRAAGLLAVLLLFSPGPVSAVTDKAPRLPVIQQVGVIPAQWVDGGHDPYGLGTARETITDAFPRAVRNSRKFRILNDDLVSTLWREPAGREELKTQFELQAFASLTATLRGDTVEISARLLSPSLDTWLHESDAVSAPWLSNASDAMIQERVDKLVFRLFNRIPQDVSVTSVQGSFITLSGGKDQGIEPGDKVDLYRTSIKSLHPANGAWLEFTRQPLGAAEIIESKSFTAVARLKSLNWDNAVEIGDGAKIPAIASRNKFVRLAENGEFRDSGSQGTIIVPPLYHSDSPAASGSATPPHTTPGDTSTLPVSGEETVNAPPPAAGGSAPGKTSDSGQPGDDQPEEAGGPSMWDTVASDATSHKVVDDVVLYTGPHWWSVKGPANSSGRFPIFLLNSLGGGISRTMLFKFKTAFGGGVLFGSTPEGSYVGYDSYAKIYWEDDLVVGEGIIKKWRAGGIGRFSGLSTSKGSYGGGDWVRGGGFGGLDGTILFGETNERYDWFGEFAVFPLNIGRIGYAGSRQVVESSFGQKFSLGAFKFEPPRVIQWGGAFEYSDERQTLKNGRRPHLTDYAIKAMAKYVF